MATTSQERAACARTLRRVLTKLATRHRLSNDDREALFEAISEELGALLREPWVFEVLDAVVGRDARRQRDSVHVVGMLAEIGGAVERMARWLTAPAPESRSAVLGSIREHQWTKLAPLLNERLEHESDPGCRTALLLACGALKSRLNTRSLLAVAVRDRKTPGTDRGPLLFALRLHGTPRAKPYFEAVLATPPPVPPKRFDDTNEHRVLAAWGLLAHGPHVQARRLLIAMLDDPPVVHTWSGGYGRDPGVSHRAAQALCDVLGLPYPDRPDEALSAVRHALARGAKGRKAQHALSSAGQMAGRTHRPRDLRGDLAAI